VRFLAAWDRDHAGAVLNAERFWFLILSPGSQANH